jgi:hypothetical protein
MLVNWIALSTCPVAASRGPRTALRSAALHVLDEPVPAGAAAEDRVKVAEDGAKLADTDVADDEAAVSGDDVWPGVGVEPWRPQAAAVARTVASRATPTGWANRDCWMRMGNPLQKQAS